MTRRRYAAAAAIAVLIAGGVAAGLVLAFTGRDARPTPEAYVAHVSAVCSRFGRQLDRIPPPTDPAAFGEVVATVGRALPVLKMEEAAIRAIRAPSALKPRRERLFALSEQSIGELEQSLAAARRRDLVGVEKGLERFVAARTRAKTLSRAIGFRC